MRVLSQFGVHAVQAHCVRDFTNSQASLVQNGDDAFVRLLHEVNDDLVVEVIDLRVTTATVTPVTASEFELLCL